MDLLLILSYAALCIAIFRIFNIPLTKWTVPTAVLGGIIIVGTLILTMNYNHPHTNMARSVYVSTPIVSQVKAQVMEVNVKPNQRISKGTLMVKLDDTLYRAKVAQAEAELIDARQAVAGLEAAYQSATSKALKAKADFERAEQDYRRYEAGLKKGAFSKGQVENRKGVYLSNKAAYEAAQSEQKRAQIAYESEINGEQTLIASAKAKLQQAQFDLDNTRIYAPTDGYVTQLTLRPGMMAVPVPLKPIMTFVHLEDNLFAAAFRQNSLLRLKPGYEAEFIFPAIPGKTFKGEVVNVLPAIGEGQLQSQGQLLGTEFFDAKGRAIVTLKMTDDMSKYPFIQGADAEVAVYSDHLEHLSVMRKVLIRMKSWQNFLYLDH